ncbi:hypothetical protein AB9K41_08770, partial [Cribrihabitans sp. XS_ASV171]
YDLTAPGVGDPGNGFSLLLVPTATYGAGGEIGFLGLEPDASDVLALALDLYQDNGEGPVPHLSLHFGNKKTEVALVDHGLGIADLITEPGRLSMSASRVEGGANVTVSLTIDGTETVLLEDFFVGGLELADRRLAIQAQNGSSTVMGLTIDNVSLTTTGPGSAPTAQPGDVLSGTLADGAAVDRYQISLDETARLVFDPMTDNDALRYVLTGPAGFEARSFTRSDSYYLTSDPVLEMPAGTYMLSVYTADESVGSYSLGLRDADAAADLEDGTPVSATLDPASRTHLYAFEWDGGETLLRLDTELTSGPVGYWKLIGPDGQVVTQRNQLGTDFESASLRQPGRYLILVEGTTNVTEPIEYTLGLSTPATTTAEMALDTVVSGEIEAAGETSRYSFSLDTAKQVLLDTLTNDTSLTFTLSGAQGTIYSRDIRSIDSTYRNDAAVLALGPGEYQVTIDAVGAATGTFAFALRDLAEATSLPLSEQQDLTLDPGNTSRLFTFEGNAGDSFYLDALDGDLQGRWKIVDRFGQLVAGSANLRSDIQSLSLNIEGTHYLLIEGEVSQTEERTHSFRMVPLTGSAAALTFGELVSGNIALPGQTSSFTFSLDEATRIYV